MATQTREPPSPQTARNNNPSNAHVPSQQELDLLFVPLYDKFFNAGSNPQNKQPTTNIQPTSAPSTPTYVHAEKNNGDQAEEDHLPDDKFTNPFCAPAQEVVESSSYNIANAHVPSQQELDLLFVPLYDKFFNADADHAGCIDSRKRTSGGIQFLGEKLVRWMSKKQNCTANSSAKAEYVALSASFAQVMWMRTQLQDYGFNYNKIFLYCDSQSSIVISCNPVQHSRTKHIHTRSSTSEASTMSQAAIRKLVTDIIAVALETQTTTMAEADNPIRNTRPREIPVAKRGNYKVLEIRNNYL
nr:uncharacterized mitochondrial protein AtMg00810-like [Tanacetum cinerariifolium]